jgi:hypothetical protein
MSERVADNHENELRVGLVNDALDRIGAITSAHNHTVRMNVNEPDYGIDTSLLTDETVVKYHTAFRECIDRIYDRWSQRREAAFRPFMIESATMELLYSPDGEYFSIVDLAMTYGGRMRYGMLKLQDEGLDYLCAMHAGEDGSTRTLASLELPKDEYFKSMILMLRTDSMLMRKFIHVHYGSIRESELEQALGEIRTMIADDIGADEADRNIDELRRRHKTALEVNQLRDQMGDTPEMSDGDLIRLCDILDRRKSAQ